MRKIIISLSFIIIKTLLESVFCIPVLMKLLADVVMMSVCRQEGDGEGQLDKVHSTLVQHLAFAAAPRTKWQISPREIQTLPQNIDYS